MLDDRWQPILAFYRELIEDHGWKQGPMLDFVLWLGASESGRDLWPSTSHESLGLATAPTYAERYQRPMAFVTYDDHQGLFAIHYHQSRNRPRRREVVADPADMAVFGRIRAWLQPD